MPKYRIHSDPVFSDTDRQVATVVMETAQLVLSQFSFVSEMTYNVSSGTLNPTIPSKPI